LTYSVVLSSAPQKFLDKLGNELFDRIIKKLETLKANPFPSDVKRVVGRKEKAFRVRVGKYRILYVVKFILIDFITTQTRQ